MFKKVIVLSVLLGIIFTVDAQLKTDGALVNQPTILPEQLGNKVSVILEAENNTVSIHLPESQQRASTVSTKYLFKDDEYNYNEAKNAIKIDLWGPFRGYTQISYEKVLGFGKSYELTLGIIGLGRNKKFEYPDTVITSGQSRKSQAGLFLGIGYKFNKLPLFEIGTKGRKHIMQGSYAKPNLYFGQYDESRIAYKGNNKFMIERPATTFIALQVEFGKEWIIANKLLLDLYWGVGYSVDNKKYYSTSYFEYNTTSAFNYCNNRIGRSPGISFTFGIKTGLLFR